MLLLAAHVATCGRCCYLRPAFPTGASAIPFGYLTCAGRGRAGTAPLRRKRKPETPSRRPSRRRWRRRLACPRQRWW
eukprot:2135098-Pyramimonas_sp.AAC.1